MRNVGLALMIMTLLATVAPAQVNPCNAPGDVPDVIVEDIFSDGTFLNRYGPVGGITAYAMGTLSCNTGSCWLDWCDEISCGSGAQQDHPTRHPVISQNLYRLKSGRFEQIGQAWLKHAFLALSLQCGASCVSTNGDHLGVNCSDPYHAGLNGQQAGLGPKDEVNAASGIFVWPFRAQGQTGNAIYKRLQVHDVDLDPTLNPSALYFAEANYTTADDAPLRDTNDDSTNDGLDDYDLVDNSANNSSYRLVDVNAFGSTFELSFSGPTAREYPAIWAWLAHDPGVVIDYVVAPGDGRYISASKATSLGGGLWHYEYAILNHSSHRSARSFSVPLPFGANLSNIGFHDVDYHSENTDGSGSFYDGTDWPSNAGTDFALTWSTQTYAENQRANALRWNTLYNFRFDVDVPLASPPNKATITLFSPGSPPIVAPRVASPSLCDGDAICDIGENSANCSADCVDQGGGGGSCGDGTCNLGEVPCSCLRDCGSPPTTESICNDGRDDDCDGLTDCPDADCCADCGGADNDGDSFEACDCDDSDDQIWSRPSEVRALVLDHDPVTGTTLAWTPPEEPGAVSISYQVLRSANPTNFMTSTSCLFDPDPSDTAVVDDSGNAAAGAAFYYLVRAENGCPQGEGVLGRNSDNIPRQGRSCP